MSVDSDAKGGPQGLLARCRHCRHKATLVRTERVERLGLGCLIRATETRHAHTQHESTGGDVNVQTLRPAMPP